MIIYISSYPRSGSSLIQQIVNNFFEKPWTEVDNSKRPLDKITGVPNYFDNWRYDPNTLSSAKSLWRIGWDKLNLKFFKIYDLDAWIALYDLAIPPYSKNCRYLLPGCKHILTPENRRKLAQEKSYFFVKTHHLPYQEYFDNEYIIQIIRHPAQVFLSYLTFIKTYNQNSQKTLDDVIRGQVAYGSWSKWHQTWNQSLCNLENKFLRLKFQDILSLGKIKTCESIKNLIKLDYNQGEHEQSFDELRRIYPKYYKQGNRDQWHQHYSQKQIDLIQVLHGNVMNDFSYLLTREPVI